MSEHYTHDDVKRAVAAAEEQYARGVSVGYWDAISAILDAVAPAIAARALKEEASPIVIDSRDQGLGLGAAQRAIWRRADEIEAEATS